jgi:hypothetical protein
LRRILRWLVGLPLVIVTILFAIANRRWIEVSLDPTSQDNPFASIPMPLWFLFFLGIALGVLVGWIGCWWAQGKWRRRAREQEAEVRRLTAERDNLKSAQVEPETAIVPMGTGWT